MVEALHATFALFCELFFLVHIFFYGHTKYMFVCTYLNFIFILYSNAITALFLLPSFNLSDLGRKNNMFFVDWYESTGELLGEGAFGHVTTYRHNRTNKEFAVKVNNERNIQ